MTSESPAVEWLELPPCQVCASLPRRLCRFLTYLRHGLVVLPPQVSLEARGEVLFTRWHAVLLSGSAETPVLVLPGEWRDSKFEEDILRDLFVQDRTNQRLDNPWLLLEKVPESKLTRAYSQPVPLLFAPTLDVKGGTPVAVATTEEFLQHWNSFSQSVLPAEWEWSNIICAGGAVLACVVPLKEYQNNALAQRKFYAEGPWNSSDVDIFIYGLTPEEATAKIHALLQMFRNHLFVRTAQPSYREQRESEECRSSFASTNLRQKC
jgi:hypothetical protein